VLARLLASLLAALAVGAISAPAADAAGTKCVALVVDFTTLGGSVSSSCVTVPTNATGSDVLVKGHKVTFDPRYGNDFVCAIDGKPAGGCHGNDNTHFWAYFHRAPHSSSWQISQEGAGTYQPANTASEGWIYDNGDSSAPKPSNVPYNSICANVKSPSPTPSPTTTPRPSRSAATAAAPTHHATATATATTRVAATATGRSSTPTVAAVTTDMATAPSTSSPASAVTAAASHHSGGGFPWPLAVAAIAAIGLGAGAVVKLRRSPG